MFEVDHWLEFAGTFYAEQLASRDADAHGQAKGFLFVLKFLHGKEEELFSIPVVVSIWEEAWSMWGVELFKSLALLTLATKKPLPTNEDLYSAACVLDPRGKPFYSPPETSWATSRPTQCAGAPAVAFPPRS